jgi:hypothetical protein
MKRIQVNRDALVHDPPRPAGRPSYSYVRMLRLALHDSNRRHAERTDERIVRLEYPPFLKWENEKPSIAPVQQVYPLF